jgi:hypothetical protein
MNRLEWRKAMAIARGARGILRRELMASGEAIVMLP